MSALHTPTEIKLHQKSKILEISFAAGETFQLPCEYLRTHARSAEIETSETPVPEAADDGLQESYWIGLAQQFRHEKEHPEIDLERDTQTLKSRDRRGVAHHGLVHHADRDTGLLRKS